MLIKISTPQDLGLVIRAARKQQKLRMDDVAGSAGVGPVFVREVERGKPTVQLGRVMQLLAELGVDLRVDVPSEVVPMFDALKQTGVKSLKPRKIAGTANAQRKSLKDDVEARKP
jgi:transcriptional regulator with XRE-family HTH domain